MGTKTVYTVKTVIIETGISKEKLREMEQYYQKVIKGLENENSGLRKDITEEKSKLKDLEYQLDSLEKNYQYEIQAQKNYYEWELKESKKKNIELKRAIENKKKEIKLLNEVINKKEAIINQLEQDKKDAENRAEQYLNKWIEAKDEIVKKNQKISELS